MHPGTSQRDVSEGRLLVLLPSYTHLKRYDNDLTAKT